MKAIQPSLDKGTRLEEGKQINSQVFLADMLDFFLQLTHCRLGRIFLPAVLCQFFFQRFNSFLHEPEQVIKIPALEGCAASALEISLKAGDDLASHHRFEGKVRGDNAPSMIQHRRLFDHRDLLVMSRFHFEMEGFVGRVG